MSDRIKTLTKTERGRVIVGSDPYHDNAHRSAGNYGASYEWLSAVKAAHERENLFHGNQNIAPVMWR